VSAAFDSGEAARLGAEAIGRLQLRASHGNMSDAGAVRRALEDGTITKEQGAALLEGWDALEREASDMRVREKARLTTLADDELVKAAIIQCASAIVAKAMKDGADKMNKTIENNMRELIRDRFGDLDKMLSGIFELETGDLLRKFKEHDAAQRPSFISALEEIDGKREGGG